MLPAPDRPALCPIGRDTGLHVRNLILDHEQTFQRFPSDPLRLFFTFMSGNKKRLMCVHHGREDGAQTIITNNAFRDPGKRFANRELSDGRRNQRLEAPRRCIHRETIDSYAIAPGTSFAPPPVTS